MILSEYQITIWRKADIMKKEVFAWEPWFFITFGLFHLHRIWGLVDRNSYAKFWLKVLENKGVFYFVLMGIVGVLFGGIYLLFDLFAISISLEFWNKLLLWMFDVTSIYWNIVWSFFILLGGFVLALGIKLLLQKKRQKFYYTDLQN